MILMKKLVSKSEKYQKIKERKEKIVQQDKISTIMTERNKNETKNQKITQYD